MATYRDHSGESYELPPMTLKVEEAFKAAGDESKTSRQQATEWLKLMTKLLPGEYVEKRCGGKTVDTVDIIELAILAGDVWDAYQAPKYAAKLANVQQLYDEMAPLIDEAERSRKVTQLPKTRQGFSRVS